MMIIPKDIITPLIDRYFILLMNPPFLSSPTHELKNGMHAYVDFLSKYLDIRIMINFDNSIDYVISYKGRDYFNIERFCDINNIKYKNFFINPPKKAVPLETQAEQLSQSLFFHLEPIFNHEG